MHLSFFFFFFILIVSWYKIWEPLFLLFDSISHFVLLNILCVKRQDLVFSCVHPSLFVHEKEILCTYLYMAFTKRAVHWLQTIHVRNMQSKVLVCLCWTSVLLKNNRCTSLQQSYEYIKECNCLREKHFKTVRCTGGMWRVWKIEI